MFILELFDETVAPPRRVAEAIKGWKHAGADIMKSRSAAAQEALPIRMTALRKDGKESGMHDATQKFASVDAARKRADDIAQMNPGRTFNYNVYDGGKLVAKFMGSNTVEQQLGESKVTAKQVDAAKEKYEAFGLKIENAKKKANHARGTGVIGELQRKKGEAYAKYQELKRALGSLTEAYALKKRVKIVGAPAPYAWIGKYGWIGEIRRGLYKGAPRTYTVDLDHGGGSIQLPSSALRLIKDDVVDESDFSIHGSGSNFDSAGFDRHMAKLRAQAELKKTNPMQALVNDLHAEDKYKDDMRKREAAARAPGDSKPDPNWDPYNAYSANSIYRQPPTNEGVSLKQKYEDKKRADQNAVRYGKMTQSEFDKKWTRSDRSNPQLQKHKD